MANAHRRFLKAGQLQQILASAGVDAPFTAHSLLDGGTYNSVYRLGFADRPGLVLKVSPDPEGTVMTYEHGIVATEAQFYTVAGEQAGLPVPEVVGLLELDPELGGGQALLVTELPGVPWFGSGLPDPARGPLRSELGRLMASMHAITGPAFGYPSESTGALNPRWGDAFGSMLAGVLADAQRYQVELPLPAEQFRHHLAACANDLAAVLVPALVHFDLWEGNVLVDLDSVPRISGLIDGERAMWGDPVMDFASAALFGEIRDDEDFIRGYELSGGVLPLDPSARRRLLLYRIYLWLIMTVEPVPRGYTENTSGAIVAERFAADLAELDRLTASVR